MGDLSGNGTVDFPDFREWKSVHLGMGGSLAGLDLGFLGGSIPEPSTAVILLVTLAALAPCRRRRHRAADDNVCVRPVATAEFET